MLREGAVTSRQREVLQAIQRSFAEGGIAPTIDDLRAALDVSSDQSVLELLYRLEKKGLVRRTAGRARSLRLTEEGHRAIGVEVGSTILRSPDPLSQRQQLIAARLADIDSKLRQIFEGGLRVLRDVENPERLYQSAHSLRELTASFSRMAKDLPEPGGHQAQAQPKSTNKQLLKRSLDPLPSSPEMDDTLYAEWDRLHNFFVGVSHHQAVSEGEYRRKLDELEELLATYVLPLQQDVYERLDKYIAGGPQATDPKHLRRVLSRNRASREYFFGKIKSEWLPFLEEHRLISPTWEVAEYFDRIADKVPDQITKLIKTFNIREDDWWTKRSVLKATLKLPGRLAGTLISKMKKERWISGTPGWAVCDVLTDLFAKLISEGRFREACFLAEYFLDETIPEELASYGGQFDWHRDLLKEFANIPAERLTAFIQLLVRHLIRAMKAEKRSYNLRYSVAWRPAIEPNEENWDFPDVRNQLFDTLRDSVERYIETLEASQAREFINREFSSAGYSIFKRFRLHIYRLHPDWFQKEIERDVLAYLDKPDTWHEYRLLAKHVFARLDSSTRHEYLKLVAQGPEGEQGAEYVKYWRLRLLRLVKNELTPHEHSQVASFLTEDIEDAPDIEPVSRRAFIMGPTSPLTAAEIDEMPLPDLARHLVSWNPSDDFRSPSREGLGRELLATVVKSPERFIEGIDTFLEPEIRPVYLAYLVGGICQALKTLKEVRWDGLLQFAVAIVQRAKAGALVNPEKEPIWGALESDWVGVFREIAGLMRAGLSSGAPAPLNRETRDTVWEIIEFLCNHPEPSTDFQRGFESKGMDPVTASINTVRGLGFHALFTYVSWRDRNCQSTKEGRIPPKAKAMLELHLDPAVDASPVIRCVYGEFFPLMLSFDPEWASSLVDRLFPTKDLPLRYAAWETYLSRQVYERAFHLLHAKYELAIAELKNGRPDRKYWSDPSQALAHHVMVAYAHGLDGSDDLRDLFFATANAELRASAVSFVGRDLFGVAVNEQGPNGRAILDRLEKFWEWRLSQSKDTEELRRFGWWIRPGRFDDQWMLEKLLQTLNITRGAIEPQYEVLKAIASLSKDFPLQCVNILTRIIHSNSDRLTLDNPAIFEALSNIRTSADKEAAKRAILLADYLARLGNERYRAIEPMESRNAPTSGQHVHIDKMEME